MDTIIDHIMNFLQYDVTSIFSRGSDCCLCLREETPSLKELANCIDHVYEPLHNDGGDGDSCNTGRAICCDGPQDDDENGDCAQLKQQGDGDDCQVEENSCDVVCKQIAAEVAEKCSSATMMELQCIEDRACKLWETLNSHLRTGTGRFPNWWDLKAWQKLPFYWAALSNEILCEEPFENFKRFYTGNKKQKRRNVKRQHEQLLITWHCLSSRQRLPFIMESFISKVGAGKVNICDEYEIQRVINDLQSK